MQRNQNDEKLLQILSVEITIDGGASLVRELKEYNSRIDNLLKNASQKKLLSFLEFYPLIFQVDRNVLPHYVYLISNDYVKDEMLQACIGNVAAAESARNCLKDRIRYIVGKETSKDVKRNMSNATVGVNQIWLLKQCKRLCHLYLRSLGFYRKVYSLKNDENDNDGDGDNDFHVKIVGSDEWIAIVLEEFIKVVKTICDVVGERVVLLPPPPEEDQPAGTATSSNNSSSSSSVEDIAAHVIRAVQQDGATHISLSLLLHRDMKLRNVLGGRDLIKLQEEYSHLFNNGKVRIFMRDYEVYLENTCPREGRMLVDETGLFSVASSKWANALASIMAKHTASVLSKDVMKTVAIDLTASVGGLTLSLAKKFKRCIAIEIDPFRADLCRQNMQIHGCGTKVHVRCQDSMEAIPELAQELAQSSQEVEEQEGKIFMVDPPWGGKYYKKDKDKNQPIMMGCWTMVQVVARIYQYMTPTVIGIRMPVDFDCESFLNELNDANVPFHVKEQKKLGPQLFIVIAV